MIRYYMASSKMAFNVNVDSKGRITKISPPSVVISDFIGLDISKLEKIMRKQGRYKKIVRRVGNPSTSDTIKLVFGDELFDLDLVNNDPWALANQCEIRISGDKELLASFIVSEDGFVVAAVFDSLIVDCYSFDVVVDRRYRKTGLGKELIDIAMDKFKSIQEDDQEATLFLDVINPILVPYLMKKYDLVVSSKLNDRTILSDK